MSTQHTAGKLPVDGDWALNATPRRLVANCGGYTDTSDPTTSGAENRANAEHLALCWNSHDDLVAALETFVAAFAQYLTDHDYAWDGPTNAADAQARAAIAAAQPVPA